jgi:hypothetical protein
MEAGAVIVNRAFGAQALSILGSGERVTVRVDRKLSEP